MASAGSRIFISYRREDSGGYAGRLFDRLSVQYGAAQVFRDIDDLGPGVDFVQEIEDSIGTAAVLIAIIGRDWPATDESGSRRLDQEEDFVRLEVGGALRKGIRVIPVLVGGAMIPADLPDDLARLRRLNALTISELEYQSGVERLFAAIDKELGGPPPPPVPVPAPTPPLP